MAPRVPPRVALRRWYALGQRHRRMAERLRRSRYLDGTVFHAYHASECVLSAFIASHGMPVPPSHSGRRSLFVQLLDPARPYAMAFGALGYLTVRVRNEALYFNEALNVFPADRYRSAFVDRLLRDLQTFARAVWLEIR